MRRSQLVLITSVLVVTLIIGALSVGVTLARQAVDPLQLSLSIGLSHEATFYVGYDPSLWCTVGEQRAIGLSLVDTTSRQSTRLVAIPLGP